MNKKQLLFNIRMEIAAVRQALRDSEEAELTEEQINGLLDRLGLLLDVANQLES
jgi:hypothetical protein